MEQSIETIWKEGFLKGDALVAPKLNDLYNQKSKLLTDKLKRMMKINVYAIVVFAFVSLIVYIAAGIPYIGLFQFSLFIGFVLYNQRNMKKMEEIDKGLSSYQYLNSFRNWIKTSINNNIPIMRFFYPLCFLTGISTAWALSDGDAISRFLLREFPNIQTLYGIPIPFLIVLVIIVVLMVVFGGKIYKWDVNIVYKGIFNKLEELILDMEELGVEK